MKLDCLVLNKDIQLSGTTVPVISPYWRLKRSGSWFLLWKYDPELVSYSILSPELGATLLLLNGDLSLRHLAMLIQYAYNLDTLEDGEKFLHKFISQVNEVNDAVVLMEDKLQPYIMKYDALNFLNEPGKSCTQHRLAYPLSLNVMFSNACQTNCVYCYASGRQVPSSQLLPVERWIEIFHEAHSLGIEQISLSGGDPLFRKDSLKLIAELINLKMLFFLSTKCHITKDMADQLNDIGMNIPINQYTREIQISMDGPDENTADVLAGSPGYFYRAMDSIDNLITGGFNFRVKAVVTPLNAPRMYEWIKLLVEHGVKRIAIAAYNRSYYRHTDNLFLSLHDRRLITEQGKRAKDNFPDIDLILTGLDPLDIKEEESNHPGKDFTSITTEIKFPGENKAEKWEKRAFCSGGRSSITITPDGKVVLCDTVPQEGEFIVGDISSQSIMDVWNSDELLGFTYPQQEKFKDTACYNCTMRTDCHGRIGYCFRDTYFNYGTIYGPPPKCPHAPNDGMQME